MFHLYFNRSAERLTTARDEIAGKDKIWAANRFQTTTLENLSFTEIYVSEGLLKIGDEEVSKTFTKLVELSA